MLYDIDILTTKDNIFRVSRANNKSESSNKWEIYLFFVLSTRIFYLLDNYVWRILVVKFLTFKLPNVQAITINILFVRLQIIFTFNSHYIFNTSSENIEYSSYEISVLETYLN